MLDCSEWLINTNYYKMYQTSSLTTIIRQFPTVDLVLYDISPVQGALVEVEVQGNRVPEAWNQHTELPLVKINPSNLMAVGKDDERLERIWGQRCCTRKSVSVATQ